MFSRNPTVIRIALRAIRTVGINTSGQIWSKDTDIASLRQNGKFIEVYRHLLSRPTTREDVVAIVVVVPPENGTNIVLNKKEVMHLGPILAE